MNDAADRWTRVEGAYHGARCRRGEERSRFLNEACGSDAVMRQQVEALLEHDEQANSLLDGPPIASMLGWPRPEDKRLTTGSRIGEYEILEPIGSGGMADVYRARDTKLHRDVALKLLPDPFALDPERLTRFQREAQVLASLNHPNIAAIYGLEESDGRPALVLELVDGPTLADRVARGPIPVDEALRIAGEIEQALEMAHEHGIIHRDLKPANIALRPDGTVKVLDFGLAKVLETTVAAGASAPPMSNPAITDAGLILGTPAYMSPEQTTGHPADKRSDVWAFGCVLYEMVTGTPAFAGETVSDTLAAVLRSEPDWTALPATVPPLVRTIIGGCLEKDRKKRIADLSTVRFLLNDSHNLVPTIVMPSTAGGGVRWTRAAVLAAIAATLISVAGVVTWNARTSLNEGTSATRVARFSFALPEEQEFTNTGRPLLALSPDGTRVIYVANRQLYLRSLSELEAQPIAGTQDEVGVTTPVFSPDGQWVAFWSASDRTLKKVTVTGGRAVTICQTDGLFGMSWGPDGILFRQDLKGIMRVSADGGAPEVLVSVADGELAYSPQALPGSHGTMFSLASGPGRFLERWDRARIVVQASNATEPTTLIEGGSDARYLSSGHIVYAVQGRLFAVPFDPGDLKVRSKPVPVLDGVARGGNTGVAQFSVSSNGSLVYIPGPASVSALPQFTVALLDVAGRLKQLKLPPGAYASPRVSPDGRQLALGVIEGEDASIWTYDLSGTSAMRRLTFGGGDRFPIWSADGQYVAFQSERDGDGAIFWQRADFSGTAERLTMPEPGTSHIPESWSPRGDVFSYSVVSDSAQGPRARYSLASFFIREKQSHPFGKVASTLPLASQFSPDGRWIAYNVSDEIVGLARSTVFVEPFPATGATYQISQSRNGFHPTWLPDGSRLSYSTGIGPEGPQWVAVDITMPPRFTIGPAVTVPNGGMVDSVQPRFQGDTAFIERNYDFTPDGRRVGLFPADSVAAARSSTIHAVLSWFDELRQRAPAR